ncbi:RNA-binding protein 5/10 [Fistulifera solaris]|uniref:RNA-binding protein 5/10 n=1 Tax=Fistulifera solaris TaxID=1519565 RepID=A0A1Z5JI40_FISSO|nr:RNA-binding protein 5/10 [Fistulifera solaris]|eukprot:GAX13680.1 RNA-binding protein 5/10 [Fistulifera solaris]
MFYEGISDFFYDPKSKLYYGNKKGMYYKYNSDMTPPFEPVQAVQSETAGKSSSMDPVPILDPSRPENGIEGSKKSIVIKLKTKSLKSTKSKSQAPSTEAPDTTVAITQLRVHKQHELDIDKWSDRQVEKRIEDRQFQRTAKGEPMCPLCRRKFPSVEKLLQHEKVSQLHKDNLAKAAQAKKEVPSQYVDRAEQRRSMYGPDVPALPNRELSTETAANSNEKTPIVDSLDNESNIGNQLLRKMGWKEGGAVGGRSEGLSAAAGLVKDWERIEQLAEQGGKDRSGRSGGGVGAL